MQDFNNFNNKTFIISALFLVAFFVLVNSIFIIEQNEQAIVLEFGKPVEFKDGDKKVSFINSPGLKFKIPFIQDVVRFDKRILNFAATDKEVLDSEKKNMTVTAFVKYKIIDPLLFYEKVTDERGIRDKMDKIIESSLRDNLGQIPLSALLTDGRQTAMNNIKKLVHDRTAVFGISVIDFRIIAADLPNENSIAIYNRVKADREKEAAEYRAQGEQESQKIRGNADAEAIKIFADAFNRDPDFYSFYRSMQAYRETISKDNTSVYLSPNSEFLKFFSQEK